MHMGNCGPMPNLYRPTMPSTDLWFWEVRDERTGRWRRPRYRMTEQDAHQRFGADVRKLEGPARSAAAIPRPTLQRLSATISERASVASLLQSVRT